MPPVAAKPILIVDDEPMVRAVAKAMLAQAGFAAVGVETGDAGLDLLRADPGGFAAVMLDLTLPGKDGAAVLADLRAAHPGLPVVLVSGQDQSAGELPGAAGFLAKPFTKDELLRAVGPYLAGS